MKGMADDNPDRGWLTDKEVGNGEKYHQKSARREHVPASSCVAAMYTCLWKSDSCVALTVIGLRVATFVFSLVAIALMAWGGSWYLPGYSLGDYYVPRKKIDPFQYSGLRLVTCR